MPHENCCRHLASLSTRANSASHGRRRLPDDTHRVARQSPHRQHGGHDTVSAPPTSEPTEQPGRVETAENLAARLDRPMGVLGVLFLFVLLGQLLVTEPTWSRALTITGWMFWIVFVAEFILRAYIARFQAAFWRRNWWQVIFLLVPFLRFVRALQAVRLLRVARVARVGSIVSAGVRGSRSAGRLLSSRIGWLAAVTGWSFWPQASCSTPSNRRRTTAPPSTKLRWPPSPERASPLRTRSPKLSSWCWRCTP